jgi:hypothetical protein
MYGLPTTYNPHAQPLPPNSIPLANHKAAKLIQDATHLSADGKRLYCEYDTEIRVHYWDAEAKRYGSSFPYVGGLPADVVRLE